MIISKDIGIEDLIEQVPASVTYLMKEGIRCVVCGEPIWGSLQEAAEEKGFNDKDIERFIGELQLLADQPSRSNDIEKKIEVKPIDTTKN